MTVVNWGEMLYIVARKGSVLGATHFAGRLDGVPVEIVPADRELAEGAAQLKTAGRISYADCYAIALAQLRGATVVTGDPEFRAFESEVQIEWLPQRPRL